MLTFAEEILLLLLDDESGEFVPAPAWSRQCALAGAVLMDLALANRIDTDLQKLVVVDPSPTGDDLLDPVLATIVETVEVQDARSWVERLAGEQSGRIQDQALARLVRRGILESEGGRLLWAFRARRYPTIDGKAEREVKLRIMQVLFSAEIPTPRGHRDHLSGRRLPHLQPDHAGAAGGAVAGEDRRGAQDGSDRKGRRRSDSRHRGVHRGDRVFAVLATLPSDRRYMFRSHSTSHETVAVIPIAASNLSSENPFENLATSLHGSVTARRPEFDLMRQAAAGPDT